MKQLLTFSITLLLLLPNFMFGLVENTLPKSVHSDSMNPRINANVASFIRKLSHDHNISHQYLTLLFSNQVKQQKVIDLISNPVESKPWHFYQRLFITKKRIISGHKFIRAHRKIINNIANEAHIPVAIIASIIGIETNYGKTQGNFNVFNALSTLSFYYPRRAEFFRSELAALLQHAYQHNMDLSNLNGSYAGAIGIPQFMPSNLLKYAVDYDHDGISDLAESMTDAIASVGNYLNKHGHWIKNTPIVHHLKLNLEQRKTVDALLKNKNSYKLSAQELKDLHIWPGYRENQHQGKHFILLAFENKNQQFEYWLGLPNFLSILSYNSSPNYAFAVWQLARKFDPSIQ